MKNFHIQNKLITQNEKEEYYKEAVPYIASFTFEIPQEDISAGEYIFVKKAIDKLSPLTKPLKLARYLKTDPKIIFEAIEKDILPYIKNGNQYVVKTKEIVPFLRKYSIIENYYHDTTSFRKHRKYKYS